MPASPSAAIYLHHAAVAAAFAQGRPLIDQAAGGCYQVHASRREAVGEAEVHLHDIDIFHVQEGAGVLVTGGRLIGARQIGPGEFRAGAIEGGDALTLSRGDVVVVPAGVPHWFMRIDRVLTYLTVKVAT